MVDRVYLPGGILSMAAAAADRLLASGNGDAALLYLLLLKTGGKSFQPEEAVRLLNWEPDRARSAFEQLVALGLADPDQAVPGPAPVRMQIPEYAKTDINRELDNPCSSFRSLVQEVQRLLGKILSDADLLSLFTIYDFTGMPAEVILMVVSWCIEEHERKYGIGRRPRMPQIQKEALRWKERGIDTIETADSYLKQLAVFRSRTSQLMRVLDLGSRPPVNREKEYLSAWINMGFPDDAIREAYERTILKKQGLHWAYMNSILKNWHQKGLHTLEQIREGDSVVMGPGYCGEPVVSPSASVQGTRGRKVQDDMERIRAFMSTQIEEEH